MHFNVERNKNIVGYIYQHDYIIFSDQFLILFIG